MQNSMCSQVLSVLRRRPDAIAVVGGSDKYLGIKGKVRFYSTRGGVIVCADIEGLPIDPQKCGGKMFAFHIHSGGECSGNQDDYFANAGTHFNPHDCAHPEHAGDMPPLIGADGRAFSVFLTDRFTIPQITGKTVIIHAHPDDFMTQPSGNSGEKIACGVIRRI